MANPYDVKPIDPALMAELTAAPAAPVFHSDDEVAAWLGENADPSQAAAKATSLADSARVSTAEAILAEEVAPLDKAQQLQVLAGEMGTNNADEAVVGMMHTLASKNNEELPPWAKDLRHYVERRNKVATQTKAQLDAFIAKQEDTVFDAVGGSSVLGVANYIREGAQAFLFTDYSFELAHIAGKYVPEFNLTDYAQPKDLYNAVGRIIATKEPDEARAMVEEIFQAIEKHAGTLQYNPVEAKEMAQVLVETVYDPKTNYRNIGQVLDAIGLIPGLGIAVKGVTGTKRAVTAAGKFVETSIGDTLGLSRTVVGPRVRPGSVADAATHTIAGAQAAVRTLREADPTASAAALGTTDAAVAGSLVLPKMAAHLDEYGRPYVLTQAQEVEDVLETGVDIKKGLDDRLAGRLKDYAITRNADGVGWDVQVVAGLPSGKGFADAAKAKSVAKEVMGDIPHEVVEVDGQHFVRWNEYYARGMKGLDTTQRQVRNRGAWAAKWLGRNNAYSEYYNKLLSYATRSTEMARSDALKDLSTYTNLGLTSRTKVNKVLQDQDFTGKIFTLDDLRLKALSPDELKAVNEVNVVREKARAMLGFNVRNRLINDGFNKVLKVGEDDIILKTLDSAPTGKVVDLITGKVIDASTLKGVKNVRTYELHEELDGVRIGVLSGKSAPFFRPLPLNPIRNIPGYLPRHYTYNFFVRDVAAGKSVAGAKTPQEADAILAALRLKNPTITYEKVRSGEITDQLTTYDELASASEQGLLWNSKRRPDLLKDINGEPQIISVEDQVQSLVEKYARNAGIARWTDQRLATVKAQYGDLFEGPLTLGSKIVPKKGRDIDKGRMREAQAILDQIALVNGLDRANVVGDLGAIRDVLSDFFWARAAELRASDTPGAGLAQAIADNIAGASHSIPDGLKTVAFVRFLGSNFLRNPFLQSSAVPVYAAVEGGTKYALSGAYARDFLILSTSKLSLDGSDTIKAAVRTAKLLGVKEEDARYIVEGWIKTGLDATIHNHLFAVGTLSDSRIIKRGLLDATVGGPVRVLKASGLDIGVRADLRGAYLTSLKRFETVNGRRAKSDDDWAEVFHWASKIAVNQNSSDILPSQRGPLGFLTQFMSHQWKWTGRLLGLEAGFTPAEKARFATYAFLNYGLDGYGMGQVLENYERVTGQKIEEPYRGLVLQGLVSGMIGATLEAVVDDPEGKESRLDLSGELSPVNFFGKFVDKATQAIFDVSISDAPSWGVSIPAIETMKDGKELMQFIGAVSGLDGVTVGEKGALIAQETLRQFPITNQILQAVAIAQTGNRVDSRGNPIYEAGNLEFLGALLGIDSKDQQSINEAMTRLKGVYQNTDSEAVSKALDEQAEDDMKWVLPLYQGFVKGEGRLEEFQHILSNHAIKTFYLYGEERGRLYYRRLMQKLQNRGPKNEQVVKAWKRDILARRVGLGPEERADINEMNFPGAQELRDWLFDYDNIGAGIGRLLEGNE